MCIQVLHICVGDSGLAQRNFHRTAGTTSVITRLIEGSRCVARRFREVRRWSTQFARHWRFSRFGGARLVRCHRNVD